LNTPFERFSGLDDDDDTVLALRRPLVAVLPFAPAGDDAALRLLGSELARQLRERLARLPALSAILISSEFIERAPEHALELICRQLHIGHLVTGKCYRHPRGRSSLYVELTETRDWHVRWAHFFRGTAHDLLLPESTGLAQLQAGLQAALLAPAMR
jgi:TolB-like protein